MEFAIKNRLIFRQGTAFVIFLVVFFLSTNEATAVQASSLSPSMCLKSYTKQSHTGFRLPDLKSKKDLEFLTLKLKQYMDLLQLEEIGDKPKHLDQIKELFAQLPGVQQREILKLIQDTYLHVKIFKYYKPLPIKKMKRQFDVILSASHDAFKFFQTAIIKNQKDVESTLQLYFNIEALRVGLPIPIDVNNLLYVAYKLQDQIRNEKVFENEKIYLYGSFVNGRSITELSDLDFAVSNPLLASKLESAKIDFPELSNFRLSEAQAHIGKKSQIHQYGYLNSLVIVIHSNTLEVRVYKSKKFMEIQKNPYFINFFI